MTINAFYTGKALLLCAAFAGLAGWYAYRQKQHGLFLLQIFIAALLVRLIVASLIFANYGQEFFGGDAFTYDFLGQTQLQAWAGDSYARVLLHNRMSGWGMGYFVGSVYALIGPNMLAIQFLNAVMGAVTAVVVFIAAQEVFTNIRVSKVTAASIAFYPSLVLWSAQGLKDGPIVFLLALAILATLKLGQKFTVKYLVVLIFALLILLSLRFYIFYMIATAVGGALVIGSRQFSAISFTRQFAILVVLAVALTYVGVPKFASEQYETFGNLEKVERSRRDMARRGESGYGEDSDVSTVDGAISNVPLGMTTKYLLKKVLKEFVPSENLTRRKMGFGVPIGYWFRGSMKGFLRETLLSEKSLGRGFFKPERIRAIVDEHIDNRVEHSHRLWSLMMLELWFQRFID